ncbi:hypothetical protein Tco_0246108 [Tanacetum coccineum]
MTCKLSCGNFVEKFLVYYIEGLNHNLFTVGHCQMMRVWKVALGNLLGFVRDLQGNDLLTGNRASRNTSIVYGIEDFSHLNFDYITLLSKKDIVTGLPKLKYVKDQLCSSCEMSKAKRSSFKSKVVPSSKGRLNLLYMDLCGPMRVASINGKKYILRHRVLEQDTPCCLSKKKHLNIRLPLLEHLNRTALSKDGTALLLRLLEQCSQLLSFHYHFGLKQLQPHAILRTDQSSYRLMERRRITSLMTGNLQ